MGHAKIIGIHDGKHIDVPANVRPLPKPIIQVRDEIKEPIKKLLIKLFDNADDAFFSMSDKSGGAGDQSLYLDSMRELRLQKKFIANTFLQQIILSFTNIEHASSAVEETVSELEGFENLSILKNDDLEMSVALEGMASRLRGNSGSQLEDFHLRMESLIQEKELKRKHTPAGPEVLCDALAYATSELNVDLKSKLIIFKLFEKFVLNEMPSVYQLANQVLIQNGVLPAIQRKKNVHTPDKAQIDQTIPVLGKEQCLTEWQFEKIRSLMHSGSTYLGANYVANGIPSGNVVVLNQDQIISTLSNYQFTDQFNFASMQFDNHAIDFRALIAEAFEAQAVNNNGRKVKYQELDNDIINLVSMLFDFILDDRQLQPTMKALIARLQIPILKVAIIDKSFFDRGGHPARKLLNEMASAAIGWTDKNAGKSDRLKLKIEQIVEKVLKEFESNLELFEELLADFVLFTDLESRRGQLIEQRTKDSEKGRAATELAKKSTEALINAVFMSNEFRGKAIPECVVELLQDGWSRVMILDYLKLGETSSEWKGHQIFIHDLVWSVCPSVDGSDARAKLLQLIPTLMRRLNQGLKEAGFDELRLNSLLQSLEQNHIAALKRLHKEAIAEQERLQKIEAEKKNTALKATGLSSSVSGSRVAQDNELKKSLDIEEDFKAFQDKLSVREINQVLEKHQAGIDNGSVVKVSLLEASEENVESVLPDNDPFMQQVSRFAVGCWFEFANNGQVERAKLAAVIKMNGRYIFVNRSGVKVAEKTKQLLAQELKSGTVQVLNDGLLFDRALESIIGNLRGQS